MSTVNNAAPTPESWTGETEAVDDARPIRQGDVFRWEKQNPPWNVFGVIVTADCDIAKGKHGGTLSYVPMLSLHDYWRLFTLPKKIETYLADKFRQPAFERVKALKAKYKPEYAGDLSEEAIIELVRSYEPDAVMEMLGVPSEERNGPLRVIRAFRAALQSSDDQTIEQLASVLAELRAAGAANVANVSPILDELPATVGQLPGDAFFVGRIAPNNAEGFVAYLRILRELRVPAVAIQPKDLRRPDVLVRRVAKLRSPFVYRLTQQLGQVFSDIGLPSDYEAQRNSLAKNARANIGRAPKTPGVS